MINLSKLMRDLVVYRRKNNISPSIHQRQGYYELVFHDNRRQSVTIKKEGSSVVFESVVLSTRTTQRKSVPKLVIDAWERNRQTDIVDFYVDDKPRLVGRIRQPIENLDRNEMEFYLETLARECDVFEYFLTGKDEQ